jgi:hypothetical protein
MTTPVTEFEELRLCCERLRGLLENLIVRGLRACGTDELLQIQSLADYLEQAGAGHVASILISLHSQIEKDDRASARTLLEAQTAVRLLERLLTLRIVQGQYAVAIAALDQSTHLKAGPAENEDELDDDED